MTAAATSPVATLRVRRPSGVVGTFRASTYRIDGGFLIATGRWKDHPHRPEREYLWPRNRVIELHREANA